MNFLRLVLLSFIILGFSLTAYGDSIRGVRRSDSKVIVEYEIDGRLWSEGDKICISSANGNDGCGLIAKIRKDKMLVQLDASAVDFTNGDSVTLRRTDRAPSSVVEGGVLVSKTHFVDLSLGIGAGLNYFYPTAHLQFSLGHQLSLGVQTQFASFSSSSTEVDSLGGFITASYYASHQNFRGLIFQAGAGLYKTDLATSTVRESHQQFAAMGSVQWRGRANWDLDWDLEMGVGLGLQYVATATGNLRTKFSGVLPLFNVFFGKSF